MRGCRRDTLPWNRLVLGQGRAYRRQDSGKDTEFTVSDVDALADTLNWDGHTRERQHDLRPCFRTAMAAMTTAFERAITRTTRRRAQDRAQSAGAGEDYQAQRQRLGYEGVLAQGPRTKVLTGQTRLPCRDAEESLTLTITYDRIPRAQRLTRHAAYCRDTALEQVPGVLLGSWEPL